MPARRLLVRKIREILRLRYEQGLSHREVAQACVIGPSSVSRYLQRAARHGLGWPLPARPRRLGARGPAVSSTGAGAWPVPGPTARTSTASSSAPGSRCSCFGREYLQVHFSGYRYTQFCEIYRQWAQRLRPSMRQVHRAGEKTFVDFSGKRPTLVDRRTGELRPVELFVAVLGASSLTYAEATATQQLADWVDAHIHMVEYIGGHDHAVGPRPVEERHRSPLPLRARGQPHLRGSGRPLRRRRHPGAAEKAPRQGSRWAGPRRHRAACAPRGRGACGGRLAMRLRSRRRSRRCSGHSRSMSVMGRSPGGAPPGPRSGPAAGRAVTFESAGTSAVYPAGQLGGGGRCRRGRPRRRRRGRARSRAAPGGAPAGRRRRRARVAVAGDHGHVVVEEHDGGRAACHGRRRVPPFPARAPRSGAGAPASRRAARPRARTYPSTASAFSPPSPVLAGGRTAVHRPPASLRIRLARSPRSGPGAYGPRPWRSSGLGGLVAARRRRRLPLSAP